jgi:hypothetical protein
MPKQKNTPIGDIKKMTPEEIRSHLILNGVKNRDIARKLGVNDSAVSLAINGYQNSRRIQEAIAESIHKPFIAVWGQKTA